jgi:hypothetical protein
MQQLPHILIVWMLQLFSAGVLLIEPVFYLRTESYNLIIKMGGGCNKPKHDQPTDCTSAPIRQQIDVFVHAHNRQGWLRASVEGD